MKIAVCVKRIIDPLTPASEFAINPETNRAIVPKGRKLVISDYDEVAVEAALIIKDTSGAEVTAFNLSNEPDEDLLRHTIAMGVDEGILLHDPKFDDSDSYATAWALSLAIQKRGGFDIILCGRQEGDWDAGQVGSGIAEILNIPLITVAGRVTVQGNAVLAERIVSDGRDVIEMPLPCLITVSNEIGIPRYPSLKRILAAKKQELVSWNANDIGYTAESKNKIVQVVVPHRESHCNFINGNTPEDAAVNLAIKLKEDKIL